MRGLLDYCLIDLVQCGAAPGKSSPDPGWVGAMSYVPASLTGSDGSAPFDQTVRSGGRACSSPHSSWPPGSTGET
jgi:hypothetical protein